MRSLGFFAAVAVVALFIVSTEAGAMDFSSLPLPDGQTPVLLLEGEIIPGDGVRFASFLAAHGLDSSARLILNSPGGNVSEAEVIAQAIRRKGLPVSVLDGQMCASACFLLFAASLDRSAAPGALIGVHSVSLFGEENLLTVGYTTMFAREASEFGVPPDVIGRLVTTQPADMAWLTQDELKEMKVHGMAATPVPERAAPQSPDYVAADAQKDEGLVGGAEPSPGVPEPVPASTSVPVYRPAEFLDGLPGVRRNASFQPRLVSSVGSGSTPRTDVPDYVAVGKTAASIPGYDPGD